MFFIYAIDTLGAQLYAPHQTNAEWVDAHRYERTLSCSCAEATSYRSRSTGSPRNIVHTNPRHFQVTNALLMRMSNTTSYMVTWTFLGGIVMIASTTWTLHVAIETGAYLHDRSARLVLIRLIAAFFIAWSAIITPIALQCG